MSRYFVNGVLWGGAYNVIKEKRMMVCETRVMNEQGRVVKKMGKTRVDGFGVNQGSQSVRIEPPSSPGLPAGTTGRTICNQFVRFGTEPLLRYA
jgi:hypothetical protein